MEWEIYGSIGVRERIQCIEKDTDTTTRATGYICNMMYDDVAPRANTETIQKRYRYSTGAKDQILSQFIWRSLWVMQFKH